MALFPLAHRAELRAQLEAERLEQECQRQLALGRPRAPIPHGNEIMPMSQLNWNPRNNDLFSHIFVSSSTTTRLPPSGVSRLNDIRKNGSAQCTIWSRCPRGNSSSRCFIPLQGRQSVLRSESRHHQMIRMRRTRRVVHEKVSKEVNKEARMTVSTIIASCSTVSY
ncbi:hypothetical protein BDZ89DRAFT_1116983 [Hymenopellis radicata]|nr:hypothetical protein BDZ89DRAFT_1116983 [Hymenopellis radicata]